MEQSSQKKVAVVFTGGTICSKLDEAFGGIVPTLSAKEILDAVPDIKSIAEVESYDFGKYPGPHITPLLMLELSRVVQNFLDRDDIAGAVVTHGTDTLEETAFFLDCTIHSNKPVVVVGAMRNSSEPDWDGPRNLRDAIAVAAQGQFENIGTVVCLAGVVNAASEVTKADTDEPNTFRSLDFGAIARITNNEIMKYRNPLHRETFNVTQLPTLVPLLKCYSGMDGEFIEHSLQRGAAGIVIEAFGVGNVTPPVYHAIVKAINSNVPVVLVSRCPVGRTEHIYAYEGAGKQLFDAGVIFADFLNGQKARIKLLCALGAGYTPEQIKQSFEWA